MMIITKILLGIFLTAICSIVLITVAVLLGHIMSNSEDYDEKTEL